jgi:hypothetical protein
MQRLSAFPAPHHEQQGVGESGWLTYASVETTCSFPLLTVKRSEKSHSLSLALTGAPPGYSQKEQVAKVQDVPLEQQGAAVQISPGSQSLSEAQVAQRLRLVQ